MPTRPKLLVRDRSSLGTEPWDDSWTKFINGECVIDDSIRVYPTPSPSCGEAEESSLQMAESQSDADISCQVFTWTLQNKSHQVSLFHHYFILRHLDVKHDSC